MSRRVERTVMNWRWWVIAPLLLLLLFLLLLIAATAWIVEGMANGVAKLAKALVAWRDGE